MSSSIARLPRWLTRRGARSSITNSELAVTQIAGRFDVLLPAVIKHLDVLARADLIERSKTGRSVHCRLRADALAKFVEEDQRSPSLASPSSAASKPRRPKSSRRGRTWKK